MKFIFVKMSNSNTKLITNTIISCIYKHDYKLTSSQKRALAILINCKYVGCCSSKHKDNVDYLLISELMDIVKCDKCFELGNCHNKYCIHIVDKFKIIKKILPLYPFDEESLSGDNFLFMIRYGNSIPKVDYNEIYDDLMDHLSRKEFTTSDDFEEEINDIIPFSREVSPSIQNKAYTIYNKLRDERGNSYRDQKITISFIEQVISAYNRL